MLWFSVLLLLCGVLSSNGQINGASYPQVMLCSTNSTYVTADCVFRSNYQGNFVSCSSSTMLEVKIIEGNESTVEYCTVYNYGGGMVAQDAYSIMTFTTNQSQGLLVDHVVFVDVNDDIPSYVDGYIDLIYIYRSSALLEILSQDNNASPTGATMFTLAEHTIYRNFPPEYIWIKLAPSFVINQ